MKTIQRFLFAILLGSVLSGCGSAIEQTAAPLPESMKGYELYSWQDGNQWRFSLLVGTNREKSLDEIKSTDTALPGMEALRATLNRVPPGQYITWSSRETLSFPPDDMLKQVEATCKNRGLILNIAK
jgi:hypothetical protein